MRFDNDSMPGGYAKLCYGRGFESGFRAPQLNSIQDTDMLGIAFVPIDTDATARLAAVEPRHEHLRRTEDEQHLFRQHHAEHQSR